MTNFVNIISAAGESDISIVPKISKISGKFSSENFSSVLKNQNKSTKFSDNSNFDKSNQPDTKNEYDKFNYKDNSIQKEKTKTPEEKQEMMRQSLLSDTFLSGANAITEDGEIINVDGNGNRVAALTFGPKSVVIACGINKIVRSVQDAETRARTIAAPINAQRFDITTPCIATGRCCDCKSPQSICCVISRIRLCKPKGRIKVVIIGESLGF